MTKEAEIFFHATRLRNARAELEKNPGYKNALAVQRAKELHDIQRRKVLKIVGRKDEN